MGETSEAQKRASMKYLKKNVKRYVLQVNRTTEPDLLEKLESVDNYNGYLKELIRKDMGQKN